MDNASNRFGSASFATRRDLKKTGFFQKERSSLFCGFWKNKPLWYSGAGGWLITAGARSGKLRDLLAYNLCHSTCLQNYVYLDVKGELSAISQNHTPNGRYCYHWNPYYLHGFGCNRFNPLEHITNDSPTRDADIIAFCQNFLPKSNSQNGEYFDTRAIEVLQSICQTEVRLSGYLTLPRLYEIVNSIPGNSDAWLEFAYEMNQSGVALSSRVEEEIANSRQDHTGGMTGIIGVIYKGFASLSDERMLAAVSPPYDLKLTDLVEGRQLSRLSLILPAEYLEGAAPILKATFASLYSIKARRPESPQMTFFIDEAGQLGAFPMLTKAFTYGAGIGLRTIAVFQSTKQMSAIGENAENIITSSAQLRTYFGVRDYETASMVSNMVGSQTLAYADQSKQAQARHAKRQAVLALINGDDPIKAAMDMRYQQREAEQLSHIQRKLLLPEEVLNLASDKMLMFADGIGKPALADRKAYWDCRFMAGRYHPNPYHPPADAVLVRTLFGHRKCKVVREAVPQRFAHLPQYADGYWFRIAA